MGCSRSLYRFFLVFGGFFIPLGALASMSSANYAVPWDEWSSGGGEVGTSASYQMADTLGGLGAGVSSSTLYTLLSGYRLGDGQALSFSVAMAPVGGSQVAYTDFSVGKRTVEISLGVGESNPFSVGDQVALIENAGLGQYTVVSRVIKIAGSTISMDRLEGDVGSLSGSPSAAKIVRLSGGNIAFGEITLSTGAVATGIVSVQAPTPVGYTVFAQSVADLASSGHTFTAVADGAVTAGSEEYGIRTIGTKATLAEDTALTSAAMSVQSSTVASEPNDDRSAFLYKLAISSVTPPGSYSQSVFFTLTANY